MKILKIALITIILFIVVVFATGGGHGTFLPAKIIYPYTMLIAIVTNNPIEIIPIIIAVIQIPIYGFIVIKKRKWFYLLLGIHFIAVIICLNIPSETF